MTDIAVDADADALREAVDAPIVFAFRVEGGAVAIVDDPDPAVVVDQARKYELGVESVTSTTWCGEPLCDAGSKVRFPSRGEGTETVEAAFPDAITVTTVLSPNEGEFWTVYSPVESRDEVRQRLDANGFDPGTATVWTFDGCTRYA